MGRQSHTEKDDENGQLKTFQGVSKQLYFSEATSWYERIAVWFLILRASRYFFSGSKVHHSQLLCISQEQQTVLRFPDMYPNASCYLEIPPCYLSETPRSKVPHARKSSKTLPKRDNIYLPYATTCCVLCSSYYVLTIYSYQNNVYHVCLNTNVITILWPFLDQTLCLSILYSRYPFG